MMTPSCPLSGHVSTCAARSTQPATIAAMKINTSEKRRGGGGGGRDPQDRKGDSCFRQRAVFGSPVCGGNSDLMYPIMAQTGSGPKPVGSS
jgi:hypothetical protein